MITGIDLICNSQKTTVADCSLNGEAIPLSYLANLTSEQISVIVGDQEPGSATLRASDYQWEFKFIRTEELQYSNEDGDAPDGGWSAAHERHIAYDLMAVKNGSPEYMGRAEWLREEWGVDTSIYPLFVSLESGQYRVWDGYRRLAGAFYNKVREVAVFLGRPCG